MVDGISPITPWQYDLLLNREAQSNDATTKTIHLPRDGHISQIDLTFEATNGATSNTGYSNGGSQGQNILDVISKIEVVADGSKTIMSVTSIEDLIAEIIRITGKLPPRKITEIAGETQILHVPIFMGRYQEDKLVMIPGGDYNGDSFFSSLDLKITYNMTASATDFVTGTFRITAGVKKLVDGSPPMTKLVKLFTKKEDYTTVSAGDKAFDLTYGSNKYLRAVQLYVYEAGISEGVDITDIELTYKGKGSGSTSRIKNTWTAQQYHNSLAYDIDGLVWAGKGFFADTDIITTRVPDIKNFNFESEAVISVTTEYVVRAEAIAGDKITMGVWVTTATGSNSTAHETDGAIHWQIYSDVIPRYVYIDLDESKTMADMIDLGRVSQINLVAANGAAGGTVRLNEEHIMTALDFKR